MAIARSMWAKWVLSGSSKLGYASFLVRTPSVVRPGAFCCLHAQSFWYNEVMPKKIKELLSGPSYWYVLDLIEADLKRLEKEYWAALCYIPVENNKLAEAGRKRADEVYAEKISFINAAKEQLRETQARAYKDHPNKGLRKYWGAGNGS